MQNGRIHAPQPLNNTGCVQGLEASLAGTNALDVSQVLTGLAGMFSEREKGQLLPLRLLHLLEPHACSLLAPFSPMASAACGSCSRTALILHRSEKT